MPRTTRTTIDRSIDVAADASTAELQRLDQLSTLITVPAGTPLMREGAIGNEVLLVVRGHVSVERGGEQIAVVGPGEVVGEQAVMCNAPRNATVTAATEVDVLAMSVREFNAVLEECPTIGRTFRDTALARAS